MGADDDARLPAGDGAARGAALRRGRAAHQPGHLDAGAGEAALEAVQVLTRQDGRGRGDQHLPARQRGMGGGAQRDLGLAEAHVAAHQAVHRAPGLHVGDDGLDGGALARRRQVGEAAGQRGDAGMHRDGGRPGGGAGSGSGGEGRGVGPDLLFHLGPAPPPGFAAHAVRAAVAAQAPHAVQVPGGNQQLGALGELQRDALLAVHVVQRGQAGDPVVLVNDQVAQAQRVGLRQDGGGIGGGTTAEQGADGQQQQARQADALRSVQFQDVDAGSVGPGRGGMGVQAAPLQAGGDAVRVGRRGDHDGRTIRRRVRGQAHQRGDADGGRDWPGIR